MPTNKNATLRYITLDKCLRNRSRFFTIKNLLEEVNAALLEDNPSSSGVQLRQLRSDLNFMRSSTGFNAEIEVFFPLGKEGCYRYQDPDFSINKTPLKEHEMEQLRSTLSILQRFDGAPGFEWMNEVSTFLADQFGVRSTQKVMSYESNIDYTGITFIAPIFNAIVNKRVLKVSYKPYVQNEFEFHFHPAYLKQYNNRWFAFGYNEEKKWETMNIALDRILTISETSKPYNNLSINWEDFFSNMIGPSGGEKEPEEIELWVSERQVPYIVTKPIHQSQKPPQYNPDGSCKIRINVVCNFELETTILSFGEGVKVLKPHHLQDKIKSRIAKSLGNY